MKKKNKVMAKEHTRHQTIFRCSKETSKFSAGEIRREAKWNVDYFIFLRVHAYRFGVQL